MLQNISIEENAQQQFYQSYYTEILQHIFSVVTDSSHTAGLNMQSLILSHMFNLLDTNKLKSLYFLYIIIMYMSIDILFL